jgi:predicted DNA-binding transcriptional regulator YafY
MKVSYIVRRYIAILGRLSNDKKASFEQLVDAIERMGGEDISISRRTIQRMFLDIEDLFHVKIKCDKSTGMYSILKEESEIDNAKITQSLQFLNYQKYLENFETHIAYDKSCMVGQEFIYDIQNAIKEKVCVQFDYTKYNSKQNSTDNRVIAPYGLKEYRGRWYLVGMDTDKGELRIFGLDRMTKLVETNQRITIPKDFDIHKYFKYSIGITIDENDISEYVELEFSTKLSGYIKNFPIHPSQAVTVETDKLIQVRFRSYINLELVNELMQYSDDVKVIKPNSLKKMMVYRAKDILGNNG